MSGAPEPHKVDLRFGVTTDGYSIEGGYNSAGLANNWVWWERRGLVPRSPDAAVFWGTPAPLLDEVASLGCDTFGLSVEWARVEPEPGVIDHEALVGYGAILEACLDRGLQPVVSLHDFTHPWWLGEEFWLTPGSPERFASHVATVVAALAEPCRHWVTVVDPGQLAYLGWITGAVPPGRRLAVADAYAVLDNLACAHVLAQRAILSVQSDATVMLRTRSSNVYELAQLWVDLVTGTDLADAGAEADAEAGRAERCSEIDAMVTRRRQRYAELVPPRGFSDRSVHFLSEALCPYGSANSTSILGSAANRLSRPSPRRVDGLVPDARDPGGLWLDLGATPGGSVRTCVRAEQQLGHGRPLWLSGDSGQAAAAVDVARQGTSVARFLLRWPGGTGRGRGAGRVESVWRATTLSGRASRYGRLIADVRDSSG